MNKMPMKYPEGEIGSRIIERLKHILYPNEPWGGQLSNKLSALLTVIKHLARNFYPGESDEEVLRRVSRYTDQGLIEAVQCLPKEGVEDAQKAAEKILGCL